MIQLHNAAQTLMRRAWLRTIIGLALAGITYVVASTSWADNPYYLQIATIACINVIMASSLNLINGFTGQFSLGHAGFMGVGAYAAAYLTTDLNVPFLPALAVGALAAALAGLVIGIPTLRLKGDYLAIATLGFSEIIRVVIVNLDQVGGARGYMGIPSITTFGWAFAFTVIAIMAIRHLMHSTHGRALLAVREDEVAAEAMGIDITRNKVLAFSIGAGLAGLAGGLFAHLITFLHPSSFDFLKSVDFLVMMVLGGWGTLTGPIGAAVGLTVLNELLRKFLELRMLAYAILLIVVMLTRPQGLVGGREFSLPTRLPGFLRRKGKTKQGGKSHEAA